MMLKWVVLIIYCVLTLRRAETKGECVDVTKHQNYRLLPRKPLCGQTIYSRPSSSVSPVAARIMNGSQTALGETPWLVYLEIKHKYVLAHIWNFLGICGGSLINDRYVLTSAFCLREESNYEKKVVARVGEWWLANEGSDCEGDLCAPERVVVPVDEILIHADYNLDQHNDICLLRLNKAVEFNNFVKPVCLPLTCYWQRRDMECQQMRISGWGFLQVVPWRVKANIAQKLTVEIMKTLDCEERYKYKIVNSQMCGNETVWKTTCQGDRGGSVEYKEIIRGLSTYYQMGIVSYGRNCRLQVAAELPPAVYTKVSSFIPWILRNIRP